MDKPFLPLALTHTNAGGQMVQAISSEWTFVSLRISSISSSQWNSSDSIRLTAAHNLVGQFDSAEFLPLSGSKSKDANPPTQVSISAGWERAFPCQPLIKPLFGALHQLLLSVTSRPKVLAFLAGSFMFHLFVLCFRPTMTTAQMLRSNHPIFPSQYH